jgi:hypothetical protein
MVPAWTWEPGAFSAGIGSPVMAASLTAAVPSITSPSTGCD